MRTHIGLHDVDDDVKEIGNNPIGLRRAFGVHRFQVMLLAKTIENLILDSAQVRLTAAGGDHEEVGHGGHLPDVQHDQIFRLLVVGQRPAGESQLFRIHLGQHHPKQAPKKDDFRNRAAGPLL